MGTIWKKKKQRRNKEEERKNGKNERKDLTLTGLLMEGVSTREHPRSGVRLRGPALKLCAWALNCAFMHTLNHLLVRLIWLVASAFFASALNGQTPEVERAVSITNEPHYRLIFDNSYVRVFRLSLTGHDATLLHQHERPYVYVSLGPVDFVNAVASKPDVHVVMADGQVAYSQGSFSHSIRTDSGSPLDIIIIELLKPQSEPQNTCADILPGPPIYHCPTTTADRKKSSSSLELFKTDETDVSLQWYGQNTQQAGITYGLGTLVVILSGSRLQTMVKGRPEKPLSVGSVLWLLAEAPTTITNPSGEPWSYLSLSFEGTEPFYQQWKPRRLQ